MQKNTTINFQTCSKNAFVVKYVRYLILFFILLHNFIWFYKFSSFHRHQTNFALQSSNRANIIREMFILYVLLPYVCFPSLCWVNFLVVVSDRFFFFIWKTKKVVAGRVRRVVALYSNDYMGICLGRLTIGPLRRMVVL